jgi:hypothetical protein
LPLGAADDGDDELSRRGGVGGEQALDGAEQHVRGLQRLDAADEEQHVGVRGRRAASRGALGAGAARAEDAEVDARRDDRDPAGSASYRSMRSPASSSVLATSRSGGGDPPAPRRSPGPAARGASPRASERFLTLAIVCIVCTSGTFQRSAASQADLAGEPVVRVHEVVPARVLLGLGAQHAGRERAQLARQVVLGEAGERAGDDVAHQDAGRSQSPGVGRRTWRG